MQRTKQERRHHTGCYQRRQIKLYKHYNHVTELTPQTIGHLRLHSAFDCGKPRCQLCCSPRYKNWVSNRERLTLQEKRNLDLFDEQLDEYFSKNG
jgi:hypothetical protein